MRDVDVLAELRAVRDETARRHGGDPWSLARELDEHARAAGLKTIRLPKREPTPPRAPKNTQPAA